MKVANCQHGHTFTVEFTAQIASDTGIQHFITGKILKNLHKSDSFFVHKLLYYDIYPSILGAFFSY